MTGRNLNQDTKIRVSIFGRTNTDRIIIKIKINKIKNKKDWLKRIREEIPERIIITEYSDRKSRIKLVLEYSML